MVTIASKIREFGGYGGHVFMINNRFRAVISDFGPNTIAAGDGRTKDEAIKNIRKVKYGYTLRFDFINGIMDDERKNQIAAWFRTLSVEQLEMISDFVEAAR